MNEVIERNVKTIQQFAVDTRKELRELQAEFRALQLQFTQQMNRNRELEEQLRAVQIRLYSGGSTSGDLD